jgi:hypothetical protein
MNFFMSQGYTREQSAGIVANLIAESSLIPTNHNRNEDSRGIAQWNNRGAAPGQPGRRDRVEQFLGSPVLQSSFQDQLRAVAWELSSSGPEARAGELLRRTTTAEEASDIIMNQYERPSQSERVRTGPIRRRQALDLLNQPAPGVTGAPETSQSRPSSGGGSGGGPAGGPTQQISIAIPHSGGRLIAAGPSNGGNEQHVAVFLLPVRMYS